MSRLGQLRYRFGQFNIAEKLILINILCFVLPFFFRTLFFLFNLPQFSWLSYFELSSDISTLVFRPWTLLSYGFFMAASGTFMEYAFVVLRCSNFSQSFFSQRFINVFFMGILVGGIVFILSYALFPVFEGQTPNMVGSSAGVMAVLIFCCTYLPTQEIRLLFFNLKLMYLGIAMVVLDVLQIPTGNAGGHLAHIGGAALVISMRCNLNKAEILGAALNAFGKPLLL